MCEDLTPCSIHRERDPNCPICNANIWDILGVTKEDWEAKKAEAEKAGTHTCENCGFVYYKTIDFCPLCYCKPGQITITESCGNVFADLGLPDAEKRLAEADEKIRQMKDK